MLLLLLAVVTGALAQATTGIGFTLVVLPACALLLDPGDVLGTVARIGLLVDLAVVWQGRGSLDLAVVRGYLVPAAVAVPVAFVAASVVPERGLVVVASVATVMAGAMLLRPAIRSGSGHPAAAGFASGFLGITIGMPGAPVAVDTAHRGLSPELSRASLAAFFAVVDLTAVIAHPDAAGIGISLALVLAAAVGLVAGAHVAGRTDATDLRKALAVLIVAGALAALGRVAL